MRRYFVGLIIGLLIAVGLSTVQADTAQAPIENAFFANQMPAGAIVYASIRTSDAYFDEIDAILNQLVTQLNTVIPMPQISSETVNIRALLNQAVGNLRLEGDFETLIRPWLGDNIAVGTYLNMENMLPSTLVAVDIANRELAEAFIENISRGFLVVNVEGNFTVYGGENADVYIALNDEALYISNIREFIPFNGAPADNLSNDPQFMTAITALPAPSYNILVTSDTSALLQLSNNSQEAQMLSALLPDAYTAIGATIVDGVSPTIDVVQIGLPEEILNLINVPLDSEFTQYIPTNATGVIHVTNLETAYNTLLEFISSQTGQDMYPQLQTANEIFGFDVIDFLLSGDVALYFTYKPEGLEGLINPQIEALTNNTQVPSGDLSQILELGYIFEVSDPTQAQSFLDTLYQLYEQFGTNTQGMTITREDIGGNSVLALTTNDAANNVDIELILGGNGKVMVFGTRQSVIDILTGNAGFDANPFYQTSLRYTLPSMTHYWFLDRNSLLAANALSQVLLGPSIERVFDNIIVGLGTSTPTPEEVARQEEMRRQQNIMNLRNLLVMQGLVENFVQVFDNATLSISTKDGILFVRTVITLSQ